MSHFRSIFRLISENNSYQVSDYGPKNNAFSTFTPSNIAGLTTWLDMSDSTVVTSSGGFIDAITNKGTVAFTFRPNSSTARPFLSASSINSRNAAGFDGVNDILTSSVTANNLFNTAGSAPPTPTASKFTICFAGRLNRVNASNGASSPLGTSVVDTIFTQGSNSTNLMVGSAFSLTQRIWFDFTDTTTLSNWVRTGAGAISSGQVVSTIVTYCTKTIDLYLNGTYVSGVIRSADPSVTFSAAARIGNAIFPESGGPAKIDLGEFLLYTGTLSQTEISQVSTYLNDKWGIT